MSDNMPFSTIGYLNVAKELDCQGRASIRDRLTINSQSGGNPGVFLRSDDGDNSNSLYFTADTDWDFNVGVNGSASSGLSVRVRNNGLSSDIHNRGDCILTDGGTYTPFTGSHIGDLEEDLEVGTILAIKSVKSVSVSDNEYEFQVCDDKTLPFGVYAGYTEEGETKANALGEGGVLVRKETCGDIKAGDYLCSHSDGSAKKKSVQKVDKMTVAKALCDVEWEEYETEKLLPVVYLMG